MKIQLASDLHLEFSDITIENNNNADVLILSGDILIASKVDKPNSEYGIRFRDFLKRCSDAFPHVIYVAGNHEFYDSGKFYASLATLELACMAHDNITFLERGVKVINDVVFVGGTLWTDMNKGDPLTLHAVRDMMNDYRSIRHDYDGYRNIRPSDTVDRHRQTRDYIFHVADENKDKKVVVVTHHSPSFQSCSEYYKTDYLMNGAYHSNLEEPIMDRPQIKLWTHGHTHNPFDYMIGETRVVCNPRGYESDTYSEDTCWNPNLILEI
jgi:DNA repair exonuclease SbcCD nuclease subunit